MKTGSWRFLICIIKILGKIRKIFFSLKAEVTSANILPMQMSVDLKIATVFFYQIHLTACNLLVFQQIFSYF